LPEVWAFVFVNPDEKLEVVVEIFQIPEVEKVDIGERLKFTKEIKESIERSSDRRLERRPLQIPFDDLHSVEEIGVPKLVRVL
jgi:hypothetical protein